MLQEALQVARTAGDHHAEAASIVYLMTAFLAAGDYDRTRRLSDEATVLLDRLGDPEGLAWTRVLRGAAAWRLGDRDDATRSLRPGLVGSADLGHVVGLSVGVFVCAQLAAETAGTTRSCSWPRPRHSASRWAPVAVRASLAPVELTTRAAEGVGEARLEGLWRRNDAGDRGLVDRAIQQLGIRRLVVLIRPAGSRWRRRAVSLIGVSSEHPDRRPGRSCRAGTRSASQPERELSSVASWSWEAAQEARA